MIAMMVRDAADLDESRATSHRFTGVIALDRDQADLPTTRGQCPVGQ
ncbi:MAG: hypothetical protein ACRCYU_08035 [Nocardioides sp.]